MTPDRDALLAEYEAGHASFHHYDSFRWQSGGLLITGALVFWAGIFSSHPSTSLRVALASFLVALLLAVWLLYAHHYRQLYMTKLYRIQQIEHQLGMSLNTQLGFLGLTAAAQQVHGPKGHKLDALMFVIVSMIGPVYQSFISEFDPQLFSAVPVIAVTLLWTYLSERKMRTGYKERFARDAQGRS